MPFPFPPYAFGNPAAMAGFDPDAAAYLATRTDVTTSVQKNAFNDLVLYRKSKSLASGTIDYAFFCMGNSLALSLTKLYGTGAIVNTAFVAGDINFTGTSVGLKGDALTKTLNTATPNSALTQSSFSLSLYITEHTTTGGADVFFGRAGEAVLGILAAISSNAQLLGGAQNITILRSSIPTPPGLLGTWTVTRTSSTLLSFYINGVLIATQTASDTTAPPHGAETGRLFSAFDAAGVAQFFFSDRRIAAYVANVGLTAQQAANEAGALNRFMALNGSGAYPVTGPFYQCYFPSNSDENLYMSQSADGVTFTYLPCTLYPTVGTVRDPSFLAYGGKWWVGYTTQGVNPGGDSIGIASCAPYSGDFATVANPSFASIVGIQYAWGANFFVDTDNSVHVITCCSTTGPIAGFVTYEIHPTNADWTTWSTPVVVAGTWLNANATFIFINPNDGLYYAQVSDGTSGIYLSRSSSLMSGWSVWKDVATHNSGNYEGTNMVHLGGTSWREYADQLSDVGMHYRDSTDDMNTFGAWTILGTPTPKAKNGLVVRDTTIAP